MSAILLLEIKVLKKVFTTYQNPYSYFHESAMIKITEDNIEMKFI